MIRRRRRSLSSQGSNRRRTYRRWHRYLGLLISLFLLILALTGFLLNHSADLGLASRHIGFAPILALYHIEANTQITSFKLGGRWISCVGESAFLDRQPMAQASGCPVGVMGKAGMWIVASREELLLLTESWELIERLGAATGVPGKISALGTGTDGELVLHTQDGWLASGPEMLQWRPLTNDAEIDWSQPTDPPPDLRRDLLLAYRGQGLSVERFVQDLHSGRLFGSWGTYGVDAVALLCLFLVVSGLAGWRRGRRTTDREPPRW